MPKEIISGIYVCIIIQIAFFGVINLLEKQNRNKLFGFFCFLVIISTIKIAFWESIQDTFFFLLFGGPHEFLYAPIIYAYLLDTSRENKNFKYHVIFPLVLYAIIHPLRIFIFDSDSHVYAPTPYYTLMVLLFTLIYFSKGIKLFKHKLNYSLKKNFETRLFLFYISLNAYLLIKYIVKAPLVYNYSIFKNEVLRDINGEIVFPLYLFLVNKVFIIFCLFFIYYALTEVYWIKRYFMGLSYNKKIITINSHELVNLKEMIHDKSIYLNRDFDMNVFLKENKIDKSIFKQYLKENNYKNSYELINTLRLNTFKSKINDNQNVKYDLLSLAIESGFKSKTTFYRVFKNMEGITPKQYVNNLKGGS